MNGLRDLLIEKLMNNECRFNEIETEGKSYGDTTLRCELEVRVSNIIKETTKARLNRIFGIESVKPYRQVIPRPGSLEFVVENSIYGLNSYSDDAIDSMAAYCCNDWSSAREALEHKKHNSIEKVIFNNPATIVFWKDGSKTVVKCEEDRFDPEKGLAMAIAKHFLGTNKTKSDYYDVFEKWLPKEEMTDEEKKIGNTILKSVSLHPFEDTLVISEKIMDDITSRIMDSLKKSDEDNIKEINEAVSDAVHKTASMFRSEPKESACDNIIDSLKKSDKDTDINL